MSRKKNHEGSFVDAGTSETRRAERFAPAVCCRVTDVLSGSLLGEVLNISRDGLMLLSLHPIDEGAIYQVSIDFDLAGVNCIEAGIECLWSDEHGNGGTVAGFHIIDISSQGLASLDRLLQASDPIS